MTRSVQTNQKPALATPRPAIPPPAAVTMLASHTWPCDKASKGGAAVPAGDNTAAATPPKQQTPVKVSYDLDSNSIHLLAGSEATLPAIAQSLNQPDALRELAPGEWLLGANLRVEAGAKLRIAAPEVRWLKLRSEASSFVRLAAYGGQLEIAGACITSWDTTHSAPDQNYDDGRSFVLARDGARMDISASDLRYLGYDADESYGLAWRQTGTSGQIVDSSIAYNYFGLYSHQASDLVIRGNHVFNNVLYGIDPHTGSKRVTIENNIVHGNGKHGIILAEECSDSVIRGNIAYDNLHHGIVIYLRSDNTLVEHNIVYGNGGQGINVNTSSHNTIRGNITYGNNEAGIGVGPDAADNLFVGNTTHDNRQHGILLYSGATGNQLRNNTIRDNTDYGIYVKSTGNTITTGNQIVGNRVGVYLGVAQPVEISRDRNQIAGNHETDILSEPSP